MFVARFICESCERPNERMSDVWLCPGCKKEVCENCFDSFAHCSSCSRSMSQSALLKSARDAGWEFVDEEADGGGH